MLAISRLVLTSLAVTMNNRKALMAHQQTSSWHTGGLTVVQVSIQLFIQEA